MQSAMDGLPLFPLRTVLFPGMALPLHIFEERYRLMIARCMEEHSPFGVVLIRSGEEVGGAANPHDIGTTARIVSVQRLEDGRMNVVALGEQRFRILQLDNSEPYLMGEVEYLQSEETDAAPLREEAPRVAALFGERHRLSLAVTGQWIRSIDLPSDPDTLADFVAYQLELPVTAKQELLEMLSVLARLRCETKLLGEQIRSLTERWEQWRKERFAGAALN